MTQIGVPVNTSQRPRKPQRSSRARLAEAIIIQVLVTASLTTGLYTAAANWFSTNNHNAEVSGYLQALDETPDEAIQAAREQAEVYNSFMPQGPLRDPFTDPGDASREDAAYDAYEELLKVSPSDTIGRVRYPAVDLSLPIYHGTSNDVLSKGAGHLYGSSLPVGGPSTHTVITAHSGLVHADLFTPILKAKVGDVFSVEVLGESQWYEVDSIETVLPSETESLRIVADRDFVTMITCTPLAVNTHRLLVRGERISPPDSSFSPEVAGDGLTAGFPWWIVGTVGGSALSAWFLFVPRKGRSDKRR